MVTNPFKLAVDAAAAAGQLAGITCAALLELIPRDDAARALDDDGFDEDTADEYLRSAAEDCGLGKHNRHPFSVGIGVPPRCDVYGCGQLRDADVHREDDTPFDGIYIAPYLQPIWLQPGDLASVQLPDGPLITGVWDPTVEGSIDFDPARLASARQRNTAHPIGTVESGLISIAPTPADDVLRSGGQTHEMPPRPRISTPGPRRTDSDRLDHLIALVEDVRNLLPTPADDEARPVRGPAAGAAPRVDSTASVDDAGRPNVNWQLLASAQRAITHWLAGASCTQTAHWQSVADELRYTANELRDQQHQLYPK